MNSKNRRHTKLPFVVLGVMLLAGTSRSHAAGTAAGTTITNQATVSYDVGTTGQPDVNSNSYAFVVDRKINMTVATTDVAVVGVTPGTNTSVLTFEIENTGNDVQDFALAAFPRSGGTGAFGGTDNVDAAAVTLFAESGATAGYQSGEDTLTYVDELAADGTATVYILGDFTSGTYANDDIASYHLVATARAGGGASALGGALTETVGADTVGTVDLVFADGQGSDTTNDLSRDAKYSDDSDFEIQTASLTVTKSSTVISDPINNTTNPKAIPGAIIEYSVSIGNGAGAATATNISITDDLDTEITAGTITFELAGYGAGQGIQVTAPNINGGSAKALTNASGDDEGNWNVTGTNTVTVSGIQLAASESATVKFRIKIVTP